ncbi:hypothetical protein SNE510_58160 [Streptomyces sp. NE5-10]|nr:hypothetical protein SNE510_58160 [Streptomyces sp. NE5-10]
MRMRSGPALVTVTRTVEIAGPSRSTAEMATFVLVASPGASAAVAAATGRSASTPATTAALNAPMNPAGLTCCSFS